MDATGARARRILVVGPSWVGDMVMAQSLFKTLKAGAPCDIDVLAPAWSLPILARMPEVRQGIVMPLGHGEFGLGKRWTLGRQLAATGYDQAIVLPGSLKSALVPLFARIPRRTGFRGEMRYGLLNDLRALDKQALPMTVQRFVALGRVAGAPLPEPFPRPALVPDAANQARLRAELGLTNRPAIAFMPGAEYGPAKQWPLAHYATLAEELVRRDFQIWILGSGKDREVGEVIAAGMGSAVLNLCGRTQLGDAVDLLAMSRAAVTNDSGLMHVAAALDIPLVALYGSSTPDHTPPLAERVVTRYLRLDCSPCFKRTCPLGHTRCLHEITPDSVVEALTQLGSLSRRIHLEAR
ncbi:lipopolysaccharide heptosyltransferase II [Pseudothauera nasutitermitis]|uniref:lipopolysaccharide heptosyltransferase II n=1 Tax=Pseudothauera nasutitermitis TaxID=2565930 RepID=A0A4V3WBG6_9RHOO|nr:lipopolysaccharide heptosyltransferase II [Pseudothauera nasutitermitis]THF63149.1 lipopolysaccharide heptosyltransferase II [Pseudothauera nasutitermitis]